MKTETEREFYIALDKIEALVKQAEAHISEGADPMPLLKEAVETAGKGLVQGFHDFFPGTTFQIIIMLTPASAEADAIELFEKVLETVQKIECSICRDEELGLILEEMAYVGLKSGSLQISEKALEETRILLKDGEQKDRRVRCLEAIVGEFQKPDFAKKPIQQPAKVQKIKKIGR